MTLGRQDISDRDTRTLCLQGTVCDRISHKSAFLFQHSHWPELPFRNTVTTAWHLRIIRRRHELRSPIQMFSSFLGKQ